MPELLRMMLSFTLVFVACVVIARSVIAQPIYQYPTPAGIIPTQVLGPYSSLPEKPFPSIPTATGVNVSASTTVPVALPGGRTVPVPLTATAQISRAALAKALARLVPIASTALAIKELYELLSPLGYRWNDSGILESPPTAGVPGDLPGTGYAYIPLDPKSPTFENFGARTPKEACEKLAARYFEPAWFNWKPVVVVDEQLRCSVTLYQKNCKPPECFTQYPYTHAPLYRYRNVFTSAYAPASESSIADAAAARMASNPDASKRLFDALQQDWRANPALPSSVNPIDADTPITVDAQPVSTPERIVKVETRQLPDGSTDTITTTEKTTVTPVTTGTTMRDIRTTYKHETITTTHTTNNVTNITTTATTVQNGEVDSPPQEDPCLAHPDRASCARLGTPPTAEPLPKNEIPLRITTAFFTSSASCPAPITFHAYGPRQISFEPLCDVMTRLRPLFLACASLATALIFLHGIRQL